MRFPTSGDYDDASPVSHGYVIAAVDHIGNTVPDLVERR